MPQAFFKNGSVIWAWLAIWSSVTKCVTWIPSPLDVAAIPHTAKQTPSRMITVQQRRPPGTQIMLPVLSWIRGVRATLPDGHPAYSDRRVTKNGITDRGNAGNDF